MEISGGKPVGAGGVSGKTRSTETREPSQEATQGAGSGSAVQVSLSPQVKAINTMKNTINAFPDVRDDKVQGISAALAAGTYKVDSKAIAGKMLDEMR